MMCRILMCFFLVFAPIISFSQEYEELFFAKPLIEAATKKPTSVEDLPFSASIIKREDIFKNGFLNLYDALDFETGIETVESYFGYSEVVVRGVYPTHYNNKTLFLLDQFPLYEVVNGSYHLEEVPLGILHRLEVIRGPGSSIYGTNAFAGILNFIPLKGENLKGFEVDQLAGIRRKGKALYRTLVTYGDKKGELDYVISGDLYLDRGYAFGVTDETRRFNETNYRNLHGSIMGIARFKGMRFFIGYFNQKKDKFGIVPVWVTTGPTTYEGAYAEGLGKFKISDKLDFTLRLGAHTFQRLSELENLGGVPVNMSSGGNMVRAEATLNAVLPAHFNLLSGITFERQHTHPYLFINADDNSVHPATAFTTSGQKENYGYYLELSYALDFLKAYAGGRVDYDTRRKSLRPTPRVGVVVQPLRNLYLKAVYSEAFRYPNFFEYDVNTRNVLIGNKKLEEEFIRDVDFSVNGTVKKLLEWSVTFFFMNANDLIGRVDSPYKDQYPQEKQYANIGSLKVYGCEGEVRVKPISFVDIVLRGTIRDGKQKGEAVIPHISNYLLDAGVYVDLPSGLSGSILYSLTGPRKYKSSSANVGSLNVLNLNLAYKWKVLTVRALFKNILGENILYPDHIRGKVKVAGENSQSFFLEVGINI